MYCPVLAEPRERLSSPLNLAPRRESIQARYGPFEESYVHRNEGLIGLKDCFNRCTCWLSSESPCWCSDRKASGTWEGDQRGDSQLKQACTATNKGPPRASSRHRTQVRKDRQRLAYNLSTLFFCNLGINHILADSK